MPGTIINTIVKCAVTSQVGITNNTYPTVGVPLTPNTAFSQSFVANANYRFTTPPSINFNGVNNPNDYTTVITDTSDGDGIVTTRNFSIVYNPQVKQPVGDEIIFIAEATQNFTPTTNNIYGYDLDTSPINPLGEKRNINVYGDPGAKVNISLFNVTECYDGQDIGTTAITIDSDGVGTYVFDCFGLKTWGAGALYDQKIRLIFTSNSGSILNFTTAVTSNPLYLYQYVDRNVFFQISRANSGTIWETANGSAIAPNVNIWNNISGSVTGWNTGGGVTLANIPDGYTATGTGIDSLRITNNGSPKSYPSDLWGLMTTVPTPALVVGETYELSFSLKTDGNDGRIDFEIQSASASRLVRKSSTGAINTWRDNFKIKFKATSTDCKFRVGTSTTGFVGGLKAWQVVEIANPRCVPLKTNVGNIFNAAAGSSKGLSFDFSYSVYAPTVSKKIAYNNIAASTGIRATYANLASSTGDIGTAAPSTTDLEIPSRDFNSWRSSTTIPLRGNLVTNKTAVLNYENGCIATVGGVNVLITYKQPVNVNRAIVTITGNLQITQFPTGGDAIVELTLASWFKESSNNF